MFGWDPAAWQNSPVPSEDTVTLLLRALISTRKVPSA
jgi:hypothetical protein